MNIQNLILVSSSLLLAACTARSESSGSSRASLPIVPVSVSSRKVTPTTTCNNSFKLHTLDHITTVRGGDRSVYDSNGSGVAVGDLDGDGLPEIVLGNIGDSSTVQWNLGNFKFKTQKLLNRMGVPETGTRAVSLVDLNSDGWLDIVFTHSQGAVAAWVNDHHKGFVLQTLEGVDYPAYTMLWDDLSGTGHLDLVTASYDAVLETELKDSFMLSRGAGVIVYDHKNAGFMPTRLAKASQSLAIAMYDINNDDKRDLIVGNDFTDPDLFYAKNNNLWQEIPGFKRTTKNTMGFSIADTDNNGTLEFFATDMKPNFADKQALAIWMPIMQKTYEKTRYNNPQRAENVLQYKTNNGGFQNGAYELGLDSTGWSWSGKFGDLNNDGILDLYVVNGMIDTENFKYLKNNELVEANKVFLGTGTQFIPQPNWNLGSLSSGRGMSITDLNNDGQLDIVVNNVSKPAQVFENQLCGGQSLQVELNWLKTENTKGIGATIYLNSSNGSKTTTMQREVVSQEGYLSGNNPRVHFGIPKENKLESLEVVWSDSKRSVVKNPTSNSILQLTREGSK